MEKIYLTEIEKEILRKATRQGVEFDLSEDIHHASCRRLAELGLLQIRSFNDEVKQARITDKGIAYKAMNPTLTNPIPEDERWSKDRKTATIALILSALSIISNIAMWLMR